MTKINEDGGTNLMDTDPVPGSSGAKQPDQPMPAQAQDMNTPGVRNLAGSIAARLAAQKQSKIDKMASWLPSTQADNVNTAIQYGDANKEIAINSQG